MLFDEEERIFQIIGRNVKYYRQMYSMTKNKITQKQLAEKVDVSTALIGNLESDKVKQGISVHTLYKIAQTLEIPIEKFFATPQLEIDGKIQYKD